MQKLLPCTILCLFLFFTTLMINFSLQSSELVKTFDNAKHQYKPWFFWYWIHGNVTPKGIHADLKAMSEAGLGGVLQEDLG